MRRDTRITIAKALGIIFVVVAHTDGHSLLSSFIFEFHMPLFFICAGYFFSLKYLTQEGKFIGRRLKGLYVPFVKWSVLFLVIHNLMFQIGVLNEQYGNSAGGVTHPYTWQVAQQRLWNIIFSMGGYDEFLAGAFWFFRGLLVASLLYLLLYKVGIVVADAVSRHNVKEMEHHGRLLQRTRMSLFIGTGVSILLFAMCLWMCASGLKITTLVQGGYRDLMGCFFFGIGFLLRPVLNKIPRNIFLDAVLLAVVLAFAIVNPAGMSVKATVGKCLALPVPALCGFLLTYQVSSILDGLNDRNIIRRFLIFCGDNTLIVFVLHISAYKLASILKIMYYDLPWGEIGCHMTIHEHANDLFWIPYTIAGVGVPLFLQYAYNRMKASIAARRLARQ